MASATPSASPDSMTSSQPQPRVIVVAPMPPEKSAYALARYSRSPDSIKDSIEWVRTHDSSKFLDSFYFQYGHASIADLGHVVMCFEGVSELAATEVEDEQLWDGQARSSRYQDFGKSGFVTPPEFSREEAARYQAAGKKLIQGYAELHGRMVDHLRTKLPKPESMKQDAYERNIAARAFDVARYALFFGVPTGVGQVTSIRTLERQIRRLKASEYAELRDLGGEITTACTEPPACKWDEKTAGEPLAPTLAKYVEPEQHPQQARADLARWAAQNLPVMPDWDERRVDLIKPTDTVADIAATLLYPVSDWPFRALYETVASWSEAQRNEVIEVALQSRTRRDELVREFRGGLYAYDMLIDIGAYRDMHRHRRCQQFRQAYGGLGMSHGYDTPTLIGEAGLTALYSELMDTTFATAAELPAPGSHYLLPFAARSRFLFKMDFAEAEYISKLRSGVKGHFSYREIAWEMKLRMEELEPALGRLIQATPPEIEDPLVR
jgi:thymidylate synthase ThyX